MTFQLVGLIAILFYALIFERCQKTYALTEGGTCRKAAGYVICLMMLLGVTAYAYSHFIEMQKDSVQNAFYRAVVIVIAVLCFYVCLQRFVRDRTRGVEHAGGVSIGSASPSPA